MDGKKHKRHIALYNKEKEQHYRYRESNQGNKKLTSTKNEAKEIYSTATTLLRAIEKSKKLLLQYSKKVYKLFRFLGAPILFSCIVSCLEYINNFCEL